MLAATLLCQVLLATAALAIPTSKERLAQRVSRRASGLTHQTRPNQAVARPETEAGSNATHAEFSTNWSGAVLVAGSVRIFLLPFNTAAMSWQLNLTRLF